MNKFFGGFIVLVLAVISFFTAWILVPVVAFALRRHSTSYARENPQRFHTGDVPRVGGMGMLGAWVLGLVWAAVGQLDPSGQVGGLSSPEAYAVLIAAIIAVVGVGVGEDISQRVSIKFRLLASLTCAALLCWGLGLSVEHIGIPGLEDWWSAHPIWGILLAVLAIGGLPHAVNIIDGYNGLAGSVSALMGFALAYMALKFGDWFLASSAIAMSAATLGFLLWNYPKGQVFAGDGGAYFWGCNIAWICVALVQRHPQVSPWFAILLLIYPVWETAFSVYRKWSRGVSPASADALHLHQLVYRRIVRAVVKDDEAQSLLMRNNRTTPYLVALNMMTLVPALVFWDKTGVLVGFCLLFVVSYTLVYVMLIRFKVPTWLR